MESKIKPIFLFADSQILFWQKNNEYFLHEVRKNILNIEPKAAYIGAANNNDPEYYSIFEAAMNNIGIINCKMISLLFDKEDKKYIEEADLILLAGGDVEKGMSFLKHKGMTELIVKRYMEGAVLIGISAGAVQLGSCGFKDDENSEYLFKSNLIETIKLIPFAVSVHCENDNWRELKVIINLSEGRERGIGIPSGAGMIYHSDHTVEPIRHTLYEFIAKDKEIKESMIIPGLLPNDKDVENVEYVEILDQIDQESDQTAYAELNKKLKI